MLKAKHNPVIFNFFKLYTVWKIKRHFYRTTFYGDFADRNLPILLVSNHTSWWDGFWVLYTNMKIFNRKFHFMMLEEQLRKFWFFNHCGGFSVNRNSVSVIESLRYSLNLLNDNRNLVLLFPQGKIESLYQHQFKFERGLEWILKKLDGKVHVIFVANLIDYFSKPKPCLSIYFEELKSEETSTEMLEKHYKDFFNRCIIMQKQIAS